MDRFWLWMRRNLDTEQIMRTVHAVSDRQQEILFQVDRLREEMETIRAALGDLRENLDMPAMVNLDNIEERRAPSGDPTGL